MVEGIRWPVDEKYTISQPFGAPAHPWEPSMYLDRDDNGWRRCRPYFFKKSRKYGDVHPGVDIACPIGTPVRAVADGKVVAAGVYSQTGEKYLMIRFHRGEKVQTLFFATHLSQVLVRIGEEVTRGQKVALSGNSGWSTGPHLHFEIRVGPVDLDAWTSSSNGLWFRWNPQRLRVGHDLADITFLE